jgi:hypothetical protein
MPLNPPPSILYKYIKREHADLLVHQGRMRIGTLLDFQNTEKHRAEVGDSQEGRRTTVVRQDPSGITRIDNLIVQGSILKNIVVKGAEVAAVYSQEVSPQFYIFCASTTKDREAMEKMGYDTCVEITNPVLFLKLLSQRSELSAKIAPIPGGHFVIGPCQYLPNLALSAAEANNSVIGGGPVPIFFQKLPEFAYQTEYRAVWSPREPNAEPILIQCEEIRALCRIVDI